MTTSSMKEYPVKELPFLLRALWFFLFGWEITIVWVGIAWLLNVTIIGLPLGLWMLNRVPQILTLKSAGGSYIENKAGDKHYSSQQQVPFLLRAIYFLAFGWWVSLFWAIFGTFFSITIIGLPLGLVMLNRLPFVTTLKR